MIGVKQNTLNMMTIHRRISLTWIKKTEHLLAPKRRMSKIKIDTIGGGIFSNTIKETYKL